MQVGVFLVVIILNEEVFTGIPHVRGGVSKKASTSSSLKESIILEKSLKKD